MKLRLTELLPMQATPDPLMVSSLTVGATLLTVTDWVAVLLFALSESLTWTETKLVARPSGKTQSKLPPGGRGGGADWLPFAPQSTLTTENVSAPGSLTVKRRCGSSPR